MEAFSAENCKAVVPVLYEDALKDKYSRDPITAEMLDILKRTVHFDFAFVNDAALNALCNVYFNAIVDKKPLSSTYTSQKKLSERLLDKLMKSYLEADEAAE